MVPDPWIELKLAGGRPCITSCIRGSRWSYTRATRLCSPIRLQTVLCGDSGKWPSCRSSSWPSPTSMRAATCATCPPSTTGSRKSSSRPSVTASASQILPNATLDQILNVFNRYRDRIVIFHYGGHADSGRLFHGIGFRHQRLPRMPPAWRTSSAGTSIQAGADHRHCSSSFSTAARPGPRPPASSRLASPQSSPRRGQFATRSPATSPPPSTPS